VSGGRGGGGPAVGGSAVGGPAASKSAVGGSAEVESGPVIEFGNEFSRVVVERVRTRNGVRLRISVPASGREIMLCPLELEALTWQDHELFTALLATPHGPESEDDNAVGPGDPDRLR